MHALDGPAQRILVIGAVVARTDAVTLCAHLVALGADEAGRTVICDLRALVEPDAAALDVLARVELFARRHGYRLRWCGASRRLRELITLAGLDSVFGLDLVEVGRQAEQREQSLGVEERVDPADSAV